MLIHKTKEVCLYNAEKRELIGVFSSRPMAGKYIYKHNWKQDTQKRLSDALKNKTRITDSILFSFPIAIRYVSPENLKLLGEKDFHICDGYPAPSEASMRGYTSDRKTLDEGAQIRRSNYWAKIKSAKET